jgi:hypothetical protein
MMHISLCLLFDLRQRWLYLRAGLTRQLGNKESEKSLESNFSMHAAQPLLASIQSNKFLYLMLLAIASVGDASVSICISAKE